MYVLVTSTLLRGYYDTLHPLIAALLAKSPAELCTRLNYSTEGCGPLVSVLWFASRVAQGELLAYALGVVGVVFVYISARLLVGGKYTPVLASLLYAFTPTVLYPALLDYYGFAVLTPLILASLVLTVKGLVDESAKLVVIGCVLQAVVVIVHTAYWALPLGISLYLLINYAKRRLSRLERVVLVYLTVITAARLVFSVFGYEYFLALLAVFLMLELIAIDALVDPRDIGARSLLSVLAFTLALVLSAAVSTVLGYGLRELGVKLALAPTVAFGFTGLLALGGLVLILRGGVSGLRHVAVVFSTLFTTLSLVAPSLTPLAVAFAAALGGLLLETVISATGLAKSRRLGVLGRVLVVVLLVAVVFGSVRVVVDHYYTVHPVVSRILPLVDRGAQARIYEWLSRVSSELSSKILENSTSRRVLIVANWEYSYWLYAELAKRGLDVYLLSNTAGSIIDKSLIARIFTASEDISRLILENVSRDLGVEDVYVIVVCDFSVRKGPLAGEAYIGYPHGVIEIQVRRELLFGVLGDLVLVPLYLNLANRSLDEYLFTQYLSMLQVHSESVLALAWTDTGADMLIVELVVSALQGLNYTRVYNRLYSYAPIDAELTWFRLLYVNATHLKSIDTRDFGVYDVYLLLGVFRVEFKSEQGSTGE